MSGKTAEEAAYRGVKFLQYLLVNYSGEAMSDLAADSEYHPVHTSADIIQAFQIVEGMEKACRVHAEGDSEETDGE